MQDSFVLCRVVKKNGLETKSDDQSIAQTENNDSSCAKNNTFRDNLALKSYTENQSKESSSPISQEDEIKKSLRFSKPEMPIVTFNDMTEDSNAIERWLDVLLDDPDQNVSLTSPVESENNTKVCSLLLFAITICSACKSTLTEGLTFRVGFLCFLP